MRFQILPFISALLLSAPALAQEGALSVDRCGGMNANPGGMRDGNVVSRKLESRITDFISNASLTPGIAIAVVKDSEIAYLRGFGYRELQTCTLAGPSTRFYLKSTTKPFLGLLAALLHEEGAVKLDAPVTNYLKDLKPAAPINADQVPLRAHFTHTIPYHDSGLNYATANFGTIPESEYVAHANEFSQPRSIEFRYSNFGPIMGAHALSAAVNKNWRDLIQQKVFEPLSMRSSFTYVSKAEAGPVALSYVTAKRGVYRETYTKDESQMHAAGGAFSTITDLARFTIANLNNGVVDDTQIFPERAVAQAQARQVQFDWEFYEFKRFAHGLGLHHADYEGDLLIHHFGGETHFSFMPEHDIGVVILTNAISDGVLVTHALAATIYDELLEKEDADQRWARRLKEINDQFDQRQERYAAYMQRVRAEAPTGPRTYSPTYLAGVYENLRLGDVVVSQDNQRLSIQIGAMDGEPEWIGGDSYLVRSSLWGRPPNVWQFRRDDETGAMLIDWGGRIFTRKE
ncbi:MAG: serine hydrolase domain-containing protein [Pseudomonadota bacterium]